MLWFFWTLPVLLQRWCSTCLVCVHTLTQRENREGPESGIFQNLLKRTQYFMNTLYIIKRLEFRTIVFFYIGQIVSFPGVAAHRDVILTGKYSKLPFDSIYSYTFLFVRLPMVSPFWLGGTPMFQSQLSSFHGWSSDAACFTNTCDGPRMWGTEWGKSSVIWMLPLKLLLLFSP